MSKLANNNADLSLVRRRVVYSLSLSFIFFLLLFYLKRKKKLQSDFNQALIGVASQIRAGYSGNGAQCLSSQTILLDVH